MTTPAEATSNQKGPAGTVLSGRYRLLSELGSGRASVVYLADDLHVVGRQVAVKVGRAEQTGQKDKPADHLLREAQALALVRHGAVPYLVDVLVQENRVALVLEYLSGRTLRDVTATDVAAEGDALEWGLRLCDVLVHLHGRRQPITHGSVRADHCMLLPAGRLVLFDFGMAAPATDTGRQADTRAVAVLTYQLLTGNRQQQGPFPSVRAYRSDVSDATDAALGAALHRSSDQAPLTLGALRRLLLECRRTTGVTSGICPYCQATTRPSARHCSSCGSPLVRDIAPDVGEVIAVARPVPPPATPAAPPPAPSRREDARPPVGTAPGRGPSLSYIQRLRAVGRHIDQRELRHVTITEDVDGFTIEGYQTSPGPPAAGQAGGNTLASVYLHATELAELAAQARQLRHQERDSAFIHSAASRPPGLLFPTGYEDGLRALGYQLDIRGVRHLSIVEKEGSLSLEYELTDDPAATGEKPQQQLTLSPSDMETILATAIDRRGSH